MSLKDIIFVGLILVTGLFFYWHGLDTGIRRTRRLFERYLGNPKVFSELPQPDLALEAQTDPPATVQVRGSRAVFSKPIQGIFGKN